MFLFLNAMFISLHISIHSIGNFSFNVPSSPLLFNAMMLFSVSISITIKPSSLYLFIVYDLSITDIKSAFFIDILVITGLFTISSYFRYCPTIVLIVIFVYPKSNIILSLYILIVVSSSLSVAIPASSFIYLPGTIDSTSPFNSVMSVLHIASLNPSKQVNFSLLPSDLTKHPFNIGRESSAARQNNVLSNILFNSTSFILNITSPNTSVKNGNVSTL